jgi:two-component system, chemotaxis family, response regulator Rcp1
MKKQRMQVLLAEDSADDVSLFARALKRAEIAVDMDVVNDGNEALQYLRRASHYAGAPTPDLMFLDLNMPKKGGHEVLAELKSDKYLRTLPVVVLSTSNAPTDVMHAYAMGATCFITKPENFDELKNFVRKLYEFWRLAEFPSEHGLQQLMASGK